MGGWNFFMPDFNKHLFLGILKLIYQTVFTEPRYIDYHYQFKTITPIYRFPQEFASIWDCWIKKGWKYKTNQYYTTYQALQLFCPVKKTHTIAM